MLNNFLIGLVVRTDGDPHRVFRGTDGGSYG